MKFIRLHGRALLLAAAAMIAVLLGCMITSEDADSETWGAWTVTTPATCYAAGMETRTSVKDATHKETRPIAQLTGTACDAETWGPWVTTTPATCSAPGVETRTSAQDANRKENRAIPQLTGTACGASPGTDLGGNGGGSASYESVTIGGKTWMRHNLNIATDNSWCYGGDGANCDRYGRLYTWNAAKTACPSGWGLPSRQDWQGLATAAGGDATGGGKLKAAGGWYEGGNGTDALGFSALPGGYRAADGGFRNAGSIAFWWTASEHDGGKAYYRSMFYEDGRVTEAARDMNSAHSVRCVQNAAVPPVNPPSTPVTPTPVYTVTVVSEGSGAGGGGNYAAGSAVLIHAGTPPGGQQFKNWTAAGVTLPNANSASTMFTMPANAVTVTAVFETASAPPVTPTPTYTATVSSAGAGSAGGGSYAAGTSVVIYAGTPPSGQTFLTWTASGVTFANPNSEMTTFTMPASAVTVTAVFETAGGTTPGTPVTYAVTVASAGSGSLGNGNYAAGTAVLIYAGTPPNGQQFKNWTTTTSGVSFADANNATTAFTMPASAVTVTAVFEASGGTAPGTTLYTVTVSGGTGATGTGSYAAGSTVTISAGTPPSGQTFKNWTTASGGVSFADANSATTAFIMPGNAVTVAAVFEAVGGTAPGTTMYTVMVSGGTGAAGTGSYAAGSTVTISAGTPPSGQTFKNWTAVGVSLANANSSQTTFIMPSNAVTVTANFETTGGTTPGGGGGVAGSTNTKETALLVRENNSYTQTIGYNGEHWFKLVGTGSEPVIIETKGDVVDTYMEVEYETTSFYPRSDNDGGEGKNAKLTFNAVSGETYFIKITTRSGTYGAYTFVVTKVDPCNIQTNATPVLVGSSTRRSIYPNCQHWYTFVGDGSRVSFEAEGGVVNATISVYKGTSAIYSEYNQKISIITIPGQTYDIQITSNNSGTYTFKLSNGPGDGSSKYDAIEVVRGGSYTSTIDYNGENWFMYQGTGLPPVTFETIGNVVDTYMEVAYEKTSPYPNSNDDGGDGKNARLTFTAVLWETYFIKITQRSQTRGAYTFVVE